MVSWKKDSHARIVSLLVRSNDVDVNLVNIYAPTNLAEQKIFFDFLHDFFIPSSAIIIGDFNWYDNALDKFGGNVSIHKEYESLKNDTTGIKRGLGVWNLNNSLLKDKDFCTSIEKLIDCHLLF